MEYSLLGAEQIGNGYALYDKSRLGEAIIVIATIDTAVVILAKEACALLGVGDAVILEGGGTCSILWYKHNAPTAISKYAI